MKNIRSLHVSLDKNFDSKFDSFRDSMIKIVKDNQNALKEEIENKAREVQNSLDMEIGIMAARMEQIEQNIKKTASTDFNPEIGIMVFGLPIRGG